MNKLKQINKLAMEIVNDETESYRLADMNAQRIVILTQPIQLNEDQQIVLDWMKSKCLHSSLSDIIIELAFLNCTGGKIRYKLVSVAWISLNEYKQLEVLQVFVEWGLSDK